ncbi:MAG TPA: hypothetical protein DE179_01150 [Oceanospirillaceae bacterium]|nr:hypothetical protein [Oceanospirillaceae bacterium]
MLTLELLGTQGCHLCDDAQQILISALDLSKVQVELVDIAESDALMQAYATRIPVLRHVATGNDLDWPFQEAQVQQFVACLKN